MWQERAQTRATQMTHMRHCLPSNHFVCCIKIKAYCVIGASFACHRETVYPHLGPPPFKSARSVEILHKPEFPGHPDFRILGSHSSEVNKRGRPSKWPPECLPSKFAHFECAFSLYFLGENMTPKDPFLEGTFWDKFWRPIRSRALLFTPEFSALWAEMTLICWAMLLVVCLSTETSLETSLFCVRRDIHCVKHVGRSLCMYCFRRGRRSTTCNGLS